MKIKRIREVCLLIESKTKLTLHLFKLISHQSVCIVFTIHPVVFCRYPKNKIYREISQRERTRSRVSSLSSNHAVWNSIDNELCIVLSHNSFFLHRHIAKNICLFNHGKVEISAYNPQNTLKIKETIILIKLMSFFKKEIMGMVVRDKTASG